MATVQLYLAPSTWERDINFWSALLRADTLFRLGHFYLATFAVTGAFMLVYGSIKRRSVDPTDRAAGAVLVRTGKAWFLVPTVLNFFIGPLVLFHLPAYGVEAFFNEGWFWLIILSVVLALAAAGLLLQDFKSDDVSSLKVWSVVGLLAVIVLSMATLRHGMRLSLVTPVMEASVAKSEAFQKEAKEAFEAAKLVPEATVAGPRGKILAEQHGGLACHTENEKLVGPAYAEVAKRNHTGETLKGLAVSPLAGRGLRPLGRRLNGG